MSASVLLMSLCCNASVSIKQFRLVQIASFTLESEAQQACLQTNIEQEQAARAALDQAASELHNLSMLCDTSKAELQSLRALALHSEADEMAALAESAANRHADGSAAVEQARTTLMQHVMNRIKATGSAEHCKHTLAYQQGLLHILQSSLAAELAAHKHHQDACQFTTAAEQRAHCAAQDEDSISCASTELQVCAGLFCSRNVPVKLSLTGAVFS